MGTGLSLIQVLIPGSRALVRGSWSSGLLREIKARAEETLGALSPAQPPQRHFILICQKSYSWAPQRTGSICHSSTLGADRVGVKTRAVCPPRMGQLLERGQEGHLPSLKYLPACSGP